jgi:F-type H+-transporting ATPase subunit b
MMLETRNFLLPDATFIIEMIAFVVVLIVMTRYVVPSIRRAMHERQDAITAALVAAQDADGRRREAHADAEAIRAEARREGRQITDQARAMRDHLITDGRNRGVEEYRWLSGRAERELQRRTELAEQHLRGRARAAAVAAAHTYLDGTVDMAQIARLVDDRLDASDRAGRTTRTQHAAA